MKNKINQVEKDMCRRWYVDYLLWLVVVMVSVGIIMLAGYNWASKRVWYYEDKWYSLLHNIHIYWIDYVIVIALTLNLFVVYRMLKKIAREIQKVSNAVSSLEEQNEEIELPEFPFLQKQIETVRLKVQVNKQEAIEATKRKNDMIMYMAHDLKTPLTSVIGYLTLLKDEQDLSIEIRTKYEEIALKKAFRLEELINEFFEVTRFNFAKMILQKQQVNMSVMLEQILFEFEPIFSVKNITYSLTKGDNIYIFCDVNKMERVFDNLFKNIANYSYENSNVEITLEKSGEQGMLLKTKNKGKTIPKEMQSAIFEQFFRMDHARNSTEGGSGLGLAVTKEIVTIHGGYITCESENETIYFTVYLPGKS